MCEWHKGFTEATTESFSEGRSEGHNRSYTRPYSTSWMGGAGPEDTSDTAAKRSRTQRRFINMNMRVFKEHLRHAAQVLTVREFSDLRRRYENIWLEVLEEL